MSDITNERLIISALLQRDAFREKVHHYIFPDYFSDAGEKAVITNIQNFVAKYQNFPTESDLIVALPGHRQSATEALAPGTARGTVGAKNKRPESHFRRFGP